MFNIDSYCTMMEVYGFFVFFDEFGNVAEKLYINQMIFSYDHRNANMSCSSVFLYDDHCLFIYKHRDTRNLIGNFRVFKDVDMIVYGAHYFPYGGTNFMLHGNYFVMQDKDDKYKVINMYFDDKFTVIKYENYQDAPIIDHSSKEFDGYPIFCGKCGEKGTSACAYYGLSYISLGNCFCTTCFIRFSKSDKEWICCRSMNHKPCFCLLDGFQCHEEHDVNANVVMNFKKTYIPPYLMKGSIEYK